jgi:hypothetical protein
MNNTPRTDAQATTHIDEEWWVSTPQVPADFARILERENTALREGMAALESMQTDPTASKIAKHYLALFPANGAAQTAATNHSKSQS